jgi:protein TonB
LKEYICITILKNTIMNKDIDLTSRDWLNLIFEGKNKSYGAYVLRDESSDRHIKALLIVVVAVLAAICLPRLVKSVAPQQQIKVVQNDGVVISQISTRTATPVEIPVMRAIVAQPVMKTMRFTPPVIVPDDKVKPDDLMRTQAALTDGGGAIGTGDVDGVVRGGIHPADVTPQAIPEPVIDKPRDYVEISPAFPGGEKAMREWLSNNLIYPELAIQQGIEGRVIIRFVVGTDGSVENVEIQKSLDPSCDKEAVRVIKKMPKWIPGKHDGSAVSAYYTLPVLFRIRH